MRRATTCTPAPCARLDSTTCAPVKTLAGTSVQNVFPGAALLLCSAQGPAAVLLLPWPVTGELHRLPLFRAGNVVLLHRLLSIPGKAFGPPKWPHHRPGRERQINKCQPKRLVPQLLGLLQLKDQKLWCLFWLPCLWSSTQRPGSALYQSTMVALASASPALLGALLGWTTRTRVAVEDYVETSLMLQYNNRPGSGLPPR